MTCISQKHIYFWSVLLNKVHHGSIHEFLVKFGMCPRHQRACPPPTWHHPTSSSHNPLWQLQGQGQVQGHKEQALKPLAPARNWLEQWTLAPSLAWMVKVGLGSVGTEMEQQQSNCGQPKAAAAIVAMRMTLWTPVCGRSWRFFQLQMPKKMLLMPLIMRNAEWGKRTAECSWNEA